MNADQVNQNQQVPPPVAPLPPPAQPLPYVAPRGANYKSPGAAVVLSFFPGIGHLYLGLYQRAIGFFSAFAFCIFLADKGDSFGILIPFVWFFGLIDAYRQTLAINAGQTPEDLWASPVRRSPRRAGLGFGVFLTVFGLLLLYNQFYPLDLTFLYDWWPLLLVGLGLWQIVRYVVAQQKKSAAEQAATDGFPSINQ